MIRVEHHCVRGVLGYVEIAGEGEPLLCIHTAGQSGLQWQEVLRTLPGHGFQVIVPDLPGHGRSGNAPDGPVLDLGLYSAWLQELVSRIGVERPLIVGCSIGGKIALELGASSALAPAGLVAMAAEAYNGRLSVPGLERSMEDAASPSRADRTFYGTVASFGASMPQEHALKRAALHRREDPVVSAADLVGWTTHDLRSRLADIRCPVRLVAGEDDFWIDRAELERTASAIGDCRYEMLPGVGHYPMEEIPQFPSVLLGWLRELTRGRAANR